MLQLFFKGAAQFAMAATLAAGGAGIATMHSSSVESSGSTEITTPEPPDAQERAAELSGSIKGRAEAQGEATAEAADDAKNRAHGQVDASVDAVSDTAGEVEAPPAPEAEEPPAPEAPSGSLSADAAASSEGSAVGSVDPGYLQLHGNNSTSGNLHLSTGL